MPQRSFRVAAEVLDDLGRLAKHLATLDRQPANQTKALAWAVARGIDAMEAAERKAEKAASDMHSEMLSELRRLSDTCEEWEEMVRNDRRARDDQTKELAVHRRRLPFLEERLRQPDSSGRWIEIDDNGKVSTCVRQPDGTISSTRELSVVTERARPESGAPR